MDQELLQWLESRPGAPREEGKGTLICAAAAGQAHKVGRAEHGGKWQSSGGPDTTYFAGNLSLTPTSLGMMVGAMQNQREISSPALEQDT